MCCYAFPVPSGSYTTKIVFLSYFIAEKRFKECIHQFQTFCVYHGNKLRLNNTAEFELLIEYKQFENGKLMISRFRFSNYNVKLVCGWHVTDE